jgi:hypothetical protein
VVAATPIGWGMTPTIIEQEALPAAPAPAPAPPPMWYYCTSPAGYFPYVQACDRPWIPVTPQATPQASPPGVPTT